MKKIIVFILIALLSVTGYSKPKKKGIFIPESVKMLTLSMNTTHSDFGPAIIGDSLYFTSFSDQAQSKTDQDLRKKEFYNLFSSKIDKQGNITGSRQVIREFMARYHDGPVSWCPATGELFITQSNYLEPGAVFKPFRKDYFNLRIVIAKKDSGEWKMVESFPYNNTGYSVGHPAVSSDGDTLIFSSNKPGGLGETDLYMSVRKKGQWGEPLNLGKRINTPGKDEFPFLSKDGYLIFASNGRKGMGGLDLYYTKLSDPKGEIVHFESPINSPNDDFSMIIPPDSEYGYLTSDRPGGAGGDDIYKFTFDHYRDNRLNLLVMDNKSRKPIQGAEVAFDDNMDFKTGNQGGLSRKIDEEMAYNVNVKAFGYTDRSKTIKTGEMKSGAMVQDTVWMDMMIKKSIALKNIYYDFDKWDILPESFEQLDKLTAFMVENPEIKVELSSHTDSRGTEIYNQDLSEKRAQSAVDYIIAKGISSDRIIAKGYGETMPITRCAQCTPEEYRMNRRTEFYISEYGKSQSVDQSGKGDYTTESNKPKSKGKNKDTKYSVIIGSFTDLPNANKIVEQLKNDGFEAVVNSDSKIFKVSTGFKDKRSARKGLTKLKTKYPDAWIL